MCSSNVPRFRIDTGIAHCIESRCPPPSNSVYVGAMLFVGRRLRVAPYQIQKSFVEDSNSEGTDCRSAGQEIRSLLRNPKADYYVH
jgi:hypothetical protein